MYDLAELFYVFAKIGALTFGGGYTMLPLLQKDIVQKYKWTTYEELIDYYAISQCLPGIIAVNTVMLIGHKQKGVPGLLAAALGMIFPSLVIILIISVFIENFMQLEVVTHGFNGIQVAVLTLVINAAIKMWTSGVKDKIGIWIFTISLAVFSFFSFSPIIMVVVSAVCGIIIKERKNTTS